jgi:hypothetical protein
VRRFIQGSALFFYLGAIASMTALFASVPLVLAVDAGVDGWRYALLGFMTVLGASQLASALANWLSALLTTPHPLPRMDFSDGLPASFRSLVVIPTLLTSEDRIDELLESLEVRFLGNRDDHLHFGLLTDFSDAAQESLSEDEPLLRRARNGIEQLNAKYSSRAADRFFLLHRPRRWNAAEKVWMGTSASGASWISTRCCAAGAATASRSSGTSPLSDIGTSLRSTLTQLPRESGDSSSGRWRTRSIIRATTKPGRIAGGTDPATARREPVRNTAFALRAALRERAWDRPVYAHRLGRLPDLFGEGSFIGRGIYDVRLRARSMPFPEIGSSATTCWKAVTRVQAC